MRSIRSYILCGVIGFFLMGTAGISYFSHQDATHEVEKIFDAQLIHSARVLNGFLPEDLNKVILERLKNSLDLVLNDELSILLYGVDGNEAGGFGPAYERVIPFGHVYESKLVFQVWNQDKELLVQSEGSRSTPLSDFKPGYTQMLLEGHRWRVFGLFDGAKKRWLFVGGREEVREKLVAKIVSRLTLPILVGLPLLALTIFFCVGKGLSPLTRLAGAIQSRNPRNLKPIAEDAVVNEIKPLVASLNSFMKELDETLNREKRFTADAAHELKTPLAVLRVHAQNALKQSKANEKQQSLNYLIQGIDRSTRVTDQLLNLARLEHDLIRIDMKRLDLKNLVVQVLRDITPLALQNKQDLGLDLIGDEFIIDGDEISLTLMIMNLVHNAIHYSPARKSITVELEERPKSIVLKIIDEGPGIPEALKKRIFDRFFRIERGKTTGTGLGLSIVLRVLESHEAKISLNKGTNDQGLCVTLVFSKAKEGETSFTQALDQAA